MKRFHNVIRVDFMDIRAVKHRISGKRFFFVALPRKLQVNGFSISVLLFIIFSDVLACEFLTPASLAARSRKLYVAPGNRLPTVHCSSDPW